MLNQQSIRMKWCRKCRDATPHEVYDIIPMTVYRLAIILTLGIGYLVLAPIQRRSPNHCTHCDALNNGRYFMQLRKKQGGLKRRRRTKPDLSPIPSVPAANPSTENSSTENTLTMS